MADDQLFYVGQKAFIDRNGKVLVLINPKLGLDFPGGKIQDGELNFDESLKREVREETSLEIEPGDPFFRWYLELGPNHRNAGKKVYLIGFKCRYLSGEVVLSDEHSEYKWVDQSSYKELDDGSDYFDALGKYFTYSLAGGYSMVHWRGGQVISRKSLGSHDVPLYWG